MLFFKISSLWFFILCTAQIVLIWSNKTHQINKLRWIENYFHSLSGIFCYSTHVTSIHPLCLARDLFVTWPSQASQYSKGGRLYKASFLFPSVTYLQEQQRHNTDYVCLHSTAVCKRRLARFVWQQKEVTSLHQPAASLVCFFFIIIIQAHTVAVLCFILLLQLTGHHKPVIKFTVSLPDGN